MAPLGLMTSTCEESTAAGLTDPSAGLGAVGGYSGLSNYTALGGQLTVFALPN